MESQEFINKGIPPQNGESMKSPEVSVEHEKPPETFKEFREKEEGMVGSFIKKAGQKLSRAALALSLFTGASSAYGQDIEKGKTAEQEAKGGTAIVEKAEETSQLSEWDKLLNSFNRVDLTFKGATEGKTPFNAESAIEVYNYKELVKSKFYAGLTKEQYKNTWDTLYSSVQHSENATEYFKNIQKLGGAEAASSLSNAQKMLFLQRLGAELYKTYNADMISKNEHVEVSDDQMIGALKDIFSENKIKPTGICGNISTFVAKTARGLGYEAWLQSTTHKAGQHIVSGVVSNDGANGEVVFLDGATMLRTGTLNYRDALGVLERENGRIALFNSFVETADKKVLQVNSSANMVAENLAGIRPTQEVLDAELGTGVIKKNVNGWEIALGPETKTINLTKNHVAVAVSNYENTFNDPYQAIQSANAVRAGTSFAGEHLELDANATYLHLSLADLQGGKVNYDSIISSVFANYINEKKLTKGEYGALSARLGATLQAAIGIPLQNAEKETKEVTGEPDPFAANNSVPASKPIGVMGEMAAGGRLIYIDPSEKNKFYVGGSLLKRGQVSDSQAQKVNFADIATRFNVGAEVSVQKGMVLGFDASKTNEAWGNKVGIKMGLKNPVEGIEVTYEKDKSHEERFIPSTTKVGAAFTYTGDPKYEIRVMGFNTTEQYKGSKPLNNFEIQVAVVVKIF